METNVLSRAYIRFEFDDGFHGDDQSQINGG